MYSMYTFNIIYFDLTVFWMFGNIFFIRFHTWQEISVVRLSYDLQNILDITHHPNTFAASLEPTQHTFSHTHTHLVSHCMRNYNAHRVHLQTV